MKKTTVYTFLLVFLCLQFSNAQSTFAPNQILISFNENASLTSINNLKGQLGATETTILPVSGIRLWTVDNFPINFIDEYGHLQNLYNILEVVNYSAGQASVDDVGLNYDVDYTTPGSGSSVAPPNVTQYNPIPDCIDFPGTLSCNAGVDNVKIAIIDTGLDQAHNFITDHVTDQFNFLTNDNNIRDNNGHGTQISGIITAELLTAGASSFELSVLKAFDNNGQGSLFHAINAIDYAISSDVDIINLSWGYIPDPLDNYNPILESILQQASEAGILIIASAGNNSFDLDQMPYYPAAFTTVENLISIAGTNCNGDLASFSNFGLNAVAVGAPAIDISCPTLHGQWIKNSGTSHSAAITTGIAAQLGTKIQGDFDAGFVKCLITTQIAPVSNLNNIVTSGGVVDAERACDMNCQFGFDYRSDDTLVESQYENATISYFPNPFTEEINLSIQTEKEGEGITRVFNAIGQLVFTHQFSVEEGENTIQLPDDFHLRQSGIYVIETKLNDQIFIEKLIKKAIR